MKKYAKLSLIFIFVSVFLMGCGSSASNKYAGAAATSEYAYNDWESNDIYEAAAEEAIDSYDGNMGDMGDVDELGEIKESTSDRKLITTVDISVETEQFDELLDRVARRVDELGGYYEASSQYNNRINSYSDGRTAHITIRVPASRLDELIIELENNSNVYSKNVQVEDVTLSYVDMQTHRDALKLEEDRLLDFMEKAETMEDLLTIEGRLTEVRYQLESMESQLRTFDNKIDYSTVNLSVEEVERVAPPVPETTWDKIRDGFAESVYDVLTGIREFFIDLIIKLPYIVVFVAVIAIVIMIIKLIVKSDKKLKEKKNRLKESENAVDVASDVDKTE